MQKDLHMLREAAHFFLHFFFRSFFFLHASWLVQAQPFCLWHRCWHSNVKTALRHGGGDGGMGKGGGGEGDGGGGKGDGDGGGGQPRCSFSQHHVDFSADHCSFVVQSKRGGDGDGGGGLGEGGGEGDGGDGEGGGGVGDGDGGGAQPRCSFFEHLLLHSFPEHSFPRHFPTRVPVKMAGLTFFELV